MTSIEVVGGYDLRLRGRVSRYRLVCFGPKHWLGLRTEELIVQRHDARSMRKRGVQLKVPVAEVEALCVGKTPDGDPVWCEISAWNTFPKMPGRRWAVLAETV